LFRIGHRDKDRAMPTAAKAEHRKPSRRRAAARSRDLEAIALLKKDHREVEALFRPMKRWKATRTS
jgi:hypothetical protein